MKLKMIIMTLLIPIVLGACSTASTSEVENGTVDIKQLVQDYSEGTINDQSASITGTELIITENDDQELVYDLPEDDFFVSIAPFIKETHPCSIHSLTGCQGELVDKELDVYIEDMEGSVIVDQTMNSEANGFIDLWLPRDQNYQVNISYDGKVTESEISTFENDDTCITTMQLT
ncbi:MAG TPA: CueP family metal-binding protein [Virgibacillus sp.]|nr:CueP family metal-binding protein [Virgibacillus sp.]